MTVKKTLNIYINKHQNKILVSLFITLGIVSIVFTSLIGLVSFQNSLSKVTEASGVYQCAAGETLSGTNCLSAPITNPIYTETCEAGYTAMDSVCVTFTQKTCADYQEAVVDTVDPTLCKIGNINNVLLSEVTDNDGRQCKGLGYNFKYYNVGLSLNSNTGPIVCTSAFSAIFGKANFRFIPRTIISIKNFVTVQMGTSSPICSSIYSLINSKCSIPAKVTSCSSGEYLSQGGSSCQTCTSNQNCNSNSTKDYFCPAGSIKTPWTGGAIPFKCFTSKNIASVSYSDGCTSVYVRYDQTCAIEESRTHDLGCSYFYASDAVNVTAIQDPSLTSTDLLRCSTGGRTDFTNTSIVKISDLQCAGPGTAWYSYNVAYDPLVCGNTYDVNNKASFRWSEKTFTKIVGLQKIPSQITVCPSNWDNYNANECVQDPIIQTYYTPTNTTSGGVTIIITNSSSISSSNIKTECVLKANEYKENGQCLACPSGTFVTSSNPFSIRDCITIVEVEKPTIRTGGYNELQSGTIAVVFTILVLTLIQAKKYHKNLLNGWIKVR
jgi:hypothetical protein